MTPVVLPANEDPKTFAVADVAYTDDGAIFNSGFLDGLPVEEAKKKAGAALKGQGDGEPTTIFRLRDWLVSRQRYWGCPDPDRPLREMRSRRRSEEGAAGPAAG